MPKMEFLIGGTATRGFAYASQSFATPCLITPVCMADAERAPLEALDEWAVPRSGAVPSLTFVAPAGGSMKARCNATYRSNAACRRSYRREPR